MRCQHLQELGLLPATGSGTAMPGEGRSIKQLEKMPPPPWGQPPAAPVLQYDL